MVSSIRRSGPVLFRVAIALSAITPQVRAQSTSCLSVDPATGATVGGATPSINADGRFVVFTTHHAYDPADTWGGRSVYRLELATGHFTLVSLSAKDEDVNASATLPRISDDGRYVAFVGSGRFLLADTNTHDDIYWRDVVSGNTKLVSKDASGASVAGDAGHPAISGDGDLVAFQSWARLVPADTNDHIDVYVRRMSTDTLELVSITPAGAAGDASSSMPALSADGSTCAFRSSAADLVAGVGGASHYYARDLVQGITTVVSCDAQGVAPSGSTRDAPAVSADGRFVAFIFSGPLDPGDSTYYDVWVKDRLTGAVARASLDEAGGEDFGLPNWPSISGDGRFVSFASDSPRLVSGDVNGMPDVFVRDLHLGVTSLLSRATDGTLADFLCWQWTSSMSADGTRVVFESGATNLAPGDGNAINDVFLRERDLTRASTTAYGTGLPGTLGTPALDASDAPRLNSTISLDVTNSVPWYTVGVFLVGKERAADPGWGGTILVVPIASLPFVAPPGTLHWPVDVPADEFLAGEPYAVQALLLDPGAPQRVAMSNGLELVVGF